MVDHGLSTPISSVGTPISLQSQTRFTGSGYKDQGVGETRNSAVVRIFDSLLTLRSHRASWSELKNVDFSTFPRQKLNYLPTKFNGNIH